MGASFALTLFGFSKGYTFCQYNPKIIVKGIPLTAGSLLVYLAFCCSPCFRWCWNSGIDISGNRDVNR